MALPVLFRTRPIRPSFRRVPFWNLSAEFDHLFEDLRRGAGSSAEEAYTPRIDLVETPSELRVSAELPGMGAEDFHVELKDGILRVHGEKESEVGDKDEVGWHRSERAYGR